MSPSLANTNLELLVAVGIAMLFVGGLAFYVIQSLLRRNDGDEKIEQFDALRDTVQEQDHIALVLPESASIDTLAATLGFQAFCTELGVTTQVFAEGEIISEDSKTFCNLFELDVTVMEGSTQGLLDCTGAIVVGGGGAVPNVSSTPVVAAIRHRPLADENILTITRLDNGATSTTVAELVQQADFDPDQRVATVLLYGIRAGTREFRRTTGETDYQAAAYLQTYADLSRVEELRAPSISDETFDVMGEAIVNRERRSSFAVTNVGKVPTVSALEEASETLLRVEGVSTVAVFGIYDEMIAISCRSDDVRTNAIASLQEAFGTHHDVSGDSDAALVRIPLGIFSETSIDENETLDELIDLSGRKTLFNAFESV